MGVVRFFTIANGYRTGLSRLPNWARALVGAFAVPGVVLLLLSIVAVVVSILALLLLTMPVYRLLAALTGRAKSPEPSDQPVFTTSADPVHGTRRRVDVRVVE